jgi:transposase
MPIGRARRGVRRRRRPTGVAVGDVAGDRRPAAWTRGAADGGRAAPAGRAATEAKSLSATERDETARAAWREQMATVDPARLVFVDECGTHTSMTRRRARAARGQRARGAVPRNRGPVTTLLAGVSLAGMVPAMTVEGGTDTAVFATYLEHFLLPSLSPGMVVVVDNVGAHQPDRIGELVTAAGCQLVFLPAYSPDLSPIEEAFSKIKALVKAAAARTRAALDAAIAAALAAVTAADVTGWFSHAGYLTRQAA